MEKYLARPSYNALGSVHETEEQAKQQATIYRDWNDEMTGYYRVFGEHSGEPRPIIPMQDIVPSRENYVRSLEAYEKDKQLFEEEVEKMRKRHASVHTYLWDGNGEDSCESFFMDPHGDGYYYDAKEEQ